MAFNTQADPPIASPPPYRPAATTLSIVGFSGMVLCVAPYPESADDYISVIDGVIDTRGHPPDCRVVDQRRWPVTPILAPTLPSLDSPRLSCYTLASDPTSKGLRCSPILYQVN